MAHILKENSILLPKEVVGIYCFCTPFLLKKAQQRLQVLQELNASLGSGALGLISDLRQILSHTGGAVLQHSRVFRVLRAHSFSSSFPTEAKNPV